MTSEFPPFAVTVDLVVLTLREERLHALVVDRGIAPFAGAPALPGGFVHADEGLADADAQRAKLEAYADTPEGVLLALAVQELAANLPRIENLVLTPDLLAPVLTRLGLGKDAA